MRIYEYLDYQKFLGEFSGRAKKVDKKYTLTQISDAIGVQKAYLSKVVKGQAHLNADQVFLLAEHLGLDEKETSYLQLLLEYSRSGLNKRKVHLRERIDRIRESETDSREKLKANFIEAETSERVAYYLDPYALLVHLFLTVDRYRKEPLLIAEALRITPDRVSEILSLLEKNGFIGWDPSENRYAVSEDHFHIHKGSPLSPPNQALVRVLSNAQILSLKPEQRSTFNITFTAGKGTYEKLQESFLAWLKSVEDLVRAAEAKEVYQLNFDLFPWDP